MNSCHPASCYLFSLLGSTQKSNFGLERMRHLMGELGHPEKAKGIIHIAGTNGKGSTAAMIESGLRAAGYSTGLYTSPHLCHINERFRINGKDVSDDGLAGAVEPVHHANERIVKKHGRSIHPTFFESVTATALELFQQAKVDYRIVETGLGGRLDASNVVHPQLAVLTRIEHDHERFLGSNLTWIANEKAAIIKKGCRAVIGTQVPIVHDVLKKYCHTVQASIMDVEQEWLVRELSSTNGFCHFEAVHNTSVIPLELSLAGDHQVANALTAVAALDCLTVSHPCIRDGLNQTYWPGRLEFVGKEPSIVLDAAHNPHGAKALATFLAQQTQGRKVSLIYGASRDKAIDESSGWLFPVADRIILTRSKVERAVSPQTLLELTSHHHSNIETAPDIAQALSRAGASSGRQDWIVVAGSLFLVGEARQLLR